MAKKNRVDLNAVIQANLPDNNTDFITPALKHESTSSISTSRSNAGVIKSVLLSGKFA